MKHSALLAAVPLLALLGSALGCSGGEASPTPGSSTPTATPVAPTEVATPTAVPETPTEAQATPELPSPPPPTEEQVAYQAAIEDAAVPESSEIIDTLVSITELNEELAWDQGKVKMVTWTSWNGYDSLIGQETTLSREVWVTAAPFVQLFCKSAGMTGDDLDLRLEELLGLPPNSGKNRFVSLWVDPVDMFRPCKDPEITDTTCGLEFPAGTSEEHIAWIENLQATSYGVNGYPWTQLGYTYDWFDDGSDVGMSEFVISSGATVTVKSVDFTSDYCGPRG